MTKYYPSQKDERNGQGSRPRLEKKPRFLTNGRKPGRNSPTAKLSPRERAHQRFKDEQLLLSKQSEQVKLFEKENSLLIPSKGIIDHVRFSLLHRLEEPDRARLEEAGFERRPMTMRAKRAPGNFVYDPDPGAELLLRESDGCRVLVWSGRIAVVASLSRVIGLTNDRLHELDERDVNNACTAITTALLPWSTLCAGFENRKWGIAEIALAIDVAADSKQYADAYEKTKWRHVQQLPNKYARGLVWKGTDHRLTIYDKGAEMQKRGVPNAPAKGTVMRVERQWQGVDAITRFARSIAHGSGPLLPFLFRSTRGASPFPSLGPIDNVVFHQLLASELALLDRPLPLGQTLADVVAAQMAVNDRFHDEVMVTISSKTRRNYRGKVLAARLESTVGQTLLRACYGQDSAWE